MSSQHTDVGAYSLGLLEQADRQEFEFHLAQCAACAAELAEFSPIQDLLTGIEPVRTSSAEAAPSQIADMIRRRAAVRRGQTRRQVLLAVAASVVLLAGGVATGIGVVPHQNTPVAQPLIPGQRFSAADPRTGVTGTVGLVDKAWGTQVTLELGRVRGPLECQLVAVSKTGERRTVVGWLVPSAGYGVPGHPAALVLQGGTAITEQNLSSLVVEVVHGATLLTIPI